MCQSIFYIYEEFGEKMKKYIQEIGEVSYRKSHKARRISIKIHSGGLVEAVLPYFVSYAQAERFVIKKKGWIIKHKEKYTRSTAQDTCFLTTTQYKTRWHNLNIIPSSDDRILLKILSDQIQIAFPQHLSVQNRQIQDAIKYGIVETLRAEARQYIPERLKMLAEATGFTYNRVFLKNLKTLWGSCSSMNNINLNIHLMRLPTHLSDYVMIHELVHTVHKNHGLVFWGMVDKLVGNGKKLARELQYYSISLRPDQPAPDEK